MFNLKQIFCSHQDHVHSERCVQRWADADNSYLSLVSCKKCGRVKYLKSKTNYFKIALWVTAIFFVSAVVSKHLKFDEKYRILKAKNASLQSALNVYEEKLKLSQGEVTLLKRKVPEKT